MRARSMLVAGVLGGAGAAVWSRYSATLRKERARVGRGSRVLASRFGQIEFAVDGAGEPVLLSHGAGGGFDQGLMIGAPLVAAGYRVIAPSRFGYLRSSSPPDPSPAQQADAFAALLDELHVDRVAVVGVSAGALAAIQLAIRHSARCRSLSLLVPAAAVTPTVAQGATPRGGSTAILELITRSDLLYWLGAKFLRGAMIRTVLGTDPALVRTASPADRSRVEEVLWSVLPISARAQGLANDARFCGAPQAIEVGKIAAPTLVISFEDDLYRTYEAARFIAANKPDARLRMYPTGGHMWVGHEREVVAELLEFLADTRATRAHAELR